MISKLPLIGPGWSPTREHGDEVRAKLNEVIDVLNALACDQCQGTGVVQLSALVEGGVMNATCLHCRGTGIGRRS